MITTSRFVRTLCLGLALALWPGLVLAKPNILVVYVDDLGYGDTSVYGHPIVDTPTIDKLAAGGLRFTQFYAPSALCSPSRAGLLTGKTPYRTGVKSWIPDNSPIALDKDEFTLADLAKSRGYRTAVIGKWHLNGGLAMDSVAQPADLGFDYQYGLGAWVKNEKAEAAGEGHLYPDNMYRNNEPVGETDRYSAELVTDEALTWLAKGDEAPFFLLLTYSEVHTPVASPPDYLDRFSGFLTEESRNHPLKYYMNWADRPYRGRGEYYANIEYLDAQLGRIIDALSRGGSLSETLIIFSSDNGPVTAEAEERWEISMAGETGGLRGKKRYLFEGGIRVPGIIYWPAKLKTPGVTDEVATALDVMPTLAEILGYDLEGHTIDGNSLIGLLDDKASTGVVRNQPFYWSIPTPDGMEYAVREGDWKLILDSQGQPAYLFNLAQDRYEVSNLLTKEPAIVDRLQEAFSQLRADVEGLIEPKLAD